MPGSSGSNRNPIEEELPMKIRPSFEVPTRMVPVLASLVARKKIDLLIFLRNAAGRGE
jgi:hypothetical protein